MAEILSHRDAKGMGYLDKPAKRLCCHCGKGIYPGDDFYHIEGEDICENCIRDFKLTEGDYDYGQRAEYEKEVDD